MSDRISLSGIQVFARHGVHEEEKSRGQTFVVDVVAELSLERPGRTDRLEDALHYGELARRIHDRVADEHWNLIEKVAERVAALVLEDHLVEAVTVTVHKPEAPVAVPFDDLSVTVHRRR